MFVLSSIFFFFKQKTAYEVRISDWSSDVCSSDLALQNSPRHRFLLTPRTTATGRGRGAPLLANDGLHLGDLAPHLTHAVGVLEQIGRASCRDRGCQYV